MSFSVSKRLRRWAAALCSAAALGAAAPGPAHAIDCHYEACLDVTLLPATNHLDWAELVSRAHRFFGVDAAVFVVSSSRAEARLPYLMLQQGRLITADQVQIPEIYHATVELQHLGERHFVWHYIIGHEMAHAYQRRIRLMEAMGRINSAVLFELHADCLAGFFLASEYGLRTEAIDQVLQELIALPSGEPGSKHYHGAPRQRFFLVSQGALMGLAQQRPSLPTASAECVRGAFQMLPGVR